MHNQLVNKYYFINKFDKNNIDKQDKETTIIYRNYIEKPDKKLILKLKNYCRKQRKKFILSNNIKLAINLNLDGAYIPSFDKNKRHLSYSFKKKFIIVGSAHNIFEIRDKEIQNVKIIFISSLFKKNSNYLGIKIIFTFWISLSTISFNKKKNYSLRWNFTSEFKTIKINQLFWLCWNFFF